MWKIYKVITGGKFLRVKFSDKCKDIANVEITDAEARAIVVLDIEIFRKIFRHSGKKSDVDKLSVIRFTRKCDVSRDYCSLAV